MRQEIEKFIIQCLDEHELKYKKVDKNTININFKSEGIRISLFVVLEEGGWLVFVTSDELRKKWNLENKQLLALTIAKLNFHTRKGSFQFNESDGEIRYKMFTGITLNTICKENIEELFLNDLTISINMMIRHQDKLIKATNGEVFNEENMESK